jgi:signal transduction histidine kinase
VQGWLLVVLAVMGVIVAAGAIAVALLLHRTDSLSRELSRFIQPSRTVAYQLQAALRDQETAVRGYVITADRSFLEPYFEGQRAERAAAQAIREGAGTRAELLRDLENIEAAAAQWRADYAEPQIAAVIPGVPSLASASATDRGKAAFDQIRTLAQTQNAHFDDARVDALHRLDQAQRWRNGVLVALLLVILATAALMGVLIRNAVTRPLEGLADACRRITEGDFARRIVPRGPSDIRAIAADVEDMRQRMVDELEAMRQARELLSEQASVLDEQAVELRRSNAELEQFAYVASHDLQEPLRKVASFCQLLEKRYGDKLDERGVEYIGFAVDGAKRMQVLINDLLTFSRVGRLNATEADVNLDAVLDAALENISAAVEDAGAQIIRPAQPLPHVLGDPMLLTVLWQNLIGNAVKFRRDDVAPRISIGCEHSGFDEPEWTFRVEDNGIGIADEFVDKVFVIFQRLHGREAYAGTGIGLALCKKIVEYHGGGIWIDTAYHDGTRVCFTLPVSELAASQTAVGQDDGAAVEEG